MSVLPVYCAAATRWIMGNFAIVSEKKLTNPRLTSHPSRYFPFSRKRNIEKRPTINCNEWVSSFWRALLVETALQMVSICRLDTIVFITWQISADLKSQNVNRSAIWNRGSSDHLKPISPYCLFWNSESWENINTKAIGFPSSAYSVDPLFSWLLHWPYSLYTVLTMRCIDCLL